MAAMRGIEAAAQKSSISNRMLALVAVHAGPTPGPQGRNWPVPRTTHL